MDRELEQVLEAREQRWLLRNELCDKNNCTIISLTLCLPHKYRTNKQIKKRFAEIAEGFTEYLVDRGMIFIDKAFLSGADGDAYLLCAKTDAQQVKMLCVGYEESSRLYRMLDIDVMDENAKPISRSDVNLPPRKCFICDNDAHICVAGRVHDAKALDEAIAYIIGNII